MIRLTLLLCLLAGPAFASGYDYDDGTSSTSSASSSNSNTSTIRNKSGGGDSTFIGLGGFATADACLQYAGAAVGVNGTGAGAAWAQMEEVCREPRWLAYAATLRDHHVECIQRCESTPGACTEDEVQLHRDELHATRAWVGRISVYAHEEYDRQHSREWSSGWGIGNNLADIFCWPFKIIPFIGPLACPR